ncbi:MAG: sugar-binding protein [Verrucomicrobiota bacterium]
MKSLTYWLIACVFTSPLWAEPALKQAASKPLYLNAFTTDLPKDLVDGDVTIQNAPAGEGKFLRLAAADGSTTSFAVNRLPLVRLTELEVRFKYRSTSATASRDRGSWVHVGFGKSDGSAAGTAAIICQPTTQWKDFSQIVPVPDGAVQCGLSFRMQQLSGQFDIAKLYIGEPLKGPAAVNTEEIDYAKACRAKANLIYKKTAAAATLAGQGLTLKPLDLTEPYGFVLPDDLCDNPELTYEVECTFKPKWSSKETSKANMLFALGKNIQGGDPDSFNLTFWGGTSLIARIKASDAAVGTQVNTPVSVTAGQRFLVKARWSSNECTLWLNGQAVDRAVMPKPFVWHKGRTFYILGEGPGSGLLNAEIEQFALRVYEPKVKAAFQGSPCDLGYFTGAGPFATALFFPAKNAKTFASTIAVVDLQGKKIAAIRPSAVTAETHNYQLPPLPFGWYKLEATITGSGAEKKLQLPISITAAAATREPAAASLYGITEEWGFGRDSFDAASADALLYRLSQMGIRWFRVWVNWDYIEETPGAYYWDGLDQCLAIAEKHGITLYPCIMGGTKPFMVTPPAQRTHRFEVSAGFCLPPDMALWNNYVKAFATRYQGRIPFYQIWNEADTRQFLYPFKTEAYAALLKQTAAIIRAADPKAKICLGGFCAAYTNFTSTRHTDQDNAYGLPEWYAQKPQSDYDVIDLHLYSAGGPAQSWDATVPMMGPLRQFFAANGDGNKPVWNSETSFQSTDNPKLVGVAGGIFNVPLLSQEMHAARVVQWHVQSKALDIKHNFNYSVRGGGGPLNSDFSPKPAYVAHLALASTLAGLKYQRTLPLNRNIRAYQFGDATRCVTVLWTLYGSELVVAKCAATDSPLTRLDLYGNRADGAGVLVLGEVPVYLESRHPPVLQELLGLRLPELLLAGRPYQAQLTVRNPFASDLLCAFEARAAGKSEARKSLTIAAGKELTETIDLSGTGSPLTIEGAFSGAVAREFALEVPVPSKKALEVSGAIPARFELAEAALVRVGGQVIDGQNRVMSGGNWKGKADLSATGTVTLRERAVTVVVQVTDDAYFPEATGKTPWAGDGVEFFFDLRTDADKIANSLDGVVHLSAGATGRSVIARKQVLKDLRVLAHKTSDGYTLTVNFTLPAHISGQFGFDVALDDADSPTAGRKVQMVWNGTANNNANAESYGVILIK